MWKSTITCDVGSAQCEDDTIKCEKKIREPSNVTKVQSCDVGTAQCEDGTIECEKK